MSLDVYLIKPPEQRHTKILIRENGIRRELTYTEFLEKFPDTPLDNGWDDDEEYYSGNITHNLTKMAAAAGIYGAVWRPEENDITTAKQLIPILTEGLTRLKSDPDRYKIFDDPHHWGTYDQFVLFLTDYLNACLEHPEAVIEVSR